MVGLMRVEDHLAHASGLTEPLILAPIQLQIFAEDQLENSSQMLISACNIFFVFVVGHIALAGQW